MLSGRLRVTLEGEVAMLADGDVVLVPAHSELRIDAGPDGETAWVTTTPGLEAVTADGTDSTVPQVDNTRLFFLIGDPADPTSTSRPEPRRRTVSVKLRSFDREGKASVSGTAQVDLQDTYLNGRDCGGSGTSWSPPRACPSPRSPPLRATVSG